MCDALHAKHTCANLSRVVTGLSSSCFELLCCNQTAIKCIKQQLSEACCTALPQAQLSSPGFVVAFVQLPASVFHVLKEQSWYIQTAVFQEQLLPRRFDSSLSSRLDSFLSCSSLWCLLKTAFCWSLQRKCMVTPGARKPLAHLAEACLLRSSLCLEMLSTVPLSRSSLACSSSSC